MPKNRNALIRYKTIDNCLRNRQRLWTLNDLIDACSDALYEYEGIDKGISKRTIQSDIQLMRSDKLGYNAPIVVSNRKFYTYDDSEYSITNIPITDQDLEKLNETVAFLKQFRGFSHFKNLDVMVQKLEDHVYAQKTNHAPIIDFEKNDNLKGLNYLDQLYDAIVKQKILVIEYKSFKAREMSKFEFKPVLLKEYRNRWFVIGNRLKHNSFMNLALDRIEGLETTDDYFHVENPFDANEYFKHTIGVTVNNVLPEKVILFILHKHAPYVITKPMHWSQKVISKDLQGVTISLEVQHNFELEKDILAFGEFVRVLAPRKLKNIIKERLSDGVDFYNSELSDLSINKAARQLEDRGNVRFNNVYTKRELRKIKRQLSKNNQLFENPIDILTNIPVLEAMLLNQNLSRLRDKISGDLVIIKATYYHYALLEPSYGIWSQMSEGDLNDNSFVVRIYINDSLDNNRALQYISGSHKAVHSKEQIETITGNAAPTAVDLKQGGVLISDPHLLRFIPSHNNIKKSGIIELVFS